MIVSHVKRIMEQKKITVSKLSEMTGLAIETIMRARRGADAGQLGSCTLITLETMARAMGVKIKDLFDEE